MLHVNMAVLLLVLLFSLSGFDRVYIDSPSTGEATLEIRNPFAARAIVSVDSVEVGELLPKATGTVENVSAGSHEVSFRLPNGFVRTEGTTAK